MTLQRAQRVEQLRRELALRRLVEQRKRAGLRQADVAERMGVSKAPSRMRQQLLHIRRVDLLNYTKLSVSRIAKTWNDESDII